MDASTLIELDCQVCVYVLFGRGGSALVCFESLDIVKLFPKFVPMQKLNAVLL